MDDYKKPGQGSSGETAETGVAGWAAGLKDQIADTTAPAKQKASEFRQQTVAKIDESRSSAAGALSSTASSLHSGGDQLSGAAHSAADKIHDAADYIRQKDLRAMTGDVQDLVKRYPVQSLAVAAVLGFLAAVALRSSD